MLPFLLTILLLDGCKNVDKVSEQSIFRYNEDAGIQVLDPAFTRSQAEIWVVSQMFNTLTEPDSNLLPGPALAKSWSIADSGRSYTFLLQSGVKFHPHRLWKLEQERILRASDVVFSLRRLVDSTLASPGAWVLLDKVNLHEDWISAPNDSTVVLKLKEACPQILSLLSMNFCMIVPERLLERGLNLKTEPVGSGPFRFAYWEPEVRMVLLKNNDYWEFDQEGKKLPYLQAVNIDLIRNKQTAFMKFVSGEYDFFNGIEGSFKDELLTREGNLASRYRGKFQMLNSPFLNTEYLGFYLDSSSGHPLQRKTLRQALSFAIDREALVRYLRNGVGDPGVHGFVPPVLLNRRVQGYGYDHEKAMSLLAEAGFPEGKGLPELELNTTADYADMAVFIQQSWSRIGIASRISVHPGGQLRQLRNKGAINLFRGSWIADYADAESYLACFSSNNLSPSGPNYTHYSDAAFNIRYSKLSNSPDSIRQEIMFQMDQQITDAAPFIVLYYDRSIRLMQKNVKGLSNNAMNQLVLKRVRKTKE
jgi:peptide/nickel transport system substrate-binding protein